VAPIATLILLGQLESGTTHPAPGDGPFLGWAPRGRLAEDARVKDGAVAAWDVEGRAAHSDVRVIYAGRQPIIGMLVVLEGRDAGGAPRLAILSGESDADEPQAPLGVRDDRPAPDPRRTRAVSLVVQDPAPVDAGPLGAATTDDRTLAMVITEPGAETNGLVSWAWDTYGDEPSSDVVVQALPASATASNSTLSVTRSGEVVYSGPPDAPARSTREAQRLGALTIGYLPSGLRARGSVRTATTASETLSRTYTDGRTWVTVTAVTEPGLTLEGLTQRVAPGQPTAPANPHDGAPAVEIRGAARGFAYLPRRSLGVVVESNQAATVEAYHVFQSISAP
jgi:hypothetical protein